MFDHERPRDRTGKLRAIYRQDALDLQGLPPSAVLPIPVMFCYFLSQKRKLVSMLCGDTKALINNIIERISVSSPVRALYIAACARLAYPRASCSGRTLRLLSDRTSAS